MEEQKLPLPAPDCSTREFDAVSVKEDRKTPKSYIFYCVMTLSVMLFTLTFAASELFSLFFSDGYPGQMLLSKFFGDGSPGKTIQEIMLGQSFLDLSLIDKTTALPDVTTAPIPADTTRPSSHPSSSAPEATTAPSPSDGTTPTDIYHYDPSIIPSGMLGVIPLDLSLSDRGQDYIYDQSDVYDVDLSKIGSISVSTDVGSVYPSGAPLVLILHTHATESYTDEGVLWYDPDREVGRSSDPERNVVSVGALLADRLNELGIPTLHCEILHDEGGYSAAYQNSAETVKRYLREYPSIQYVIDLHRDAVQRSSGEIVRPVTECEDGAAAQIMCVVGSGASSVGGDHWERNLALAQKLRAELNSTEPKLCRPTCLRDSAYNQHLAPYSLLLEMGAAGNTLSEVYRSAELVAKALFAVIAG